MRSAGRWFLMGLVIVLLAGCATTVKNAAPQKSISHNPLQNPADDRRPITIQLIDAKTGNAVKEGAVHVIAYLPGNKRDNEEVRLPVDADGKAVFYILKQATPESSLAIETSVKSYVPMRKRSENLPTSPDSYTIKLDPCTPIGGIIKDEAGKPIENVRVNILLDRTEEMKNETGNYDSPSIPVRTNAEGRWQCYEIPTNAQQILVRLEHPDFISDSMYGLTTPPPIDQLRAMTGEMVMKRGVEVKGTVVDDAGNPIAKATVAQGDNRWGTSYPETRTAADGSFVFHSCALEQMVLTVQAKGFAPDLKKIPVDQLGKPVEFRLGPPNVIKGRITDPDGKPVEDAFVVADTWRGCRSIHWRVNTDADGRFVWNEAPSDPVLCDMGKEGFLYIRNKSLTTQADEYAITMCRPLNVIVQATDKTTGTPLAEFKVESGIQWEGNGQVSWGSCGNETTKGENGRAELTFSDPYPAYLIKASAPGYLPGVSRAIKPEEGKVEIALALEKGTGPAGRVLGLDGKPFEGASLYLILPGQGLNIANSKVTDRNSNVLSALSGTDGRFELSPVEDVAWLMLVISHDGWAKLKKADFKQNGDISLQAWGRVEGTLRLDGALKTNEKIILWDSAPFNPANPYISFHNECITNAEGQFAFEKVLPGEWRAGFCVQHGANGYTYSHGVPITLESGKTETITVGGTGHPVTGKCILNPEAQGKANWDRGSFTIETDIAGPTPPKGLSKEQIAKWYKEYQDSGKALKEMQAHRWYAIKFNADGTFRVPDVPPGEYTLKMQFFAEPANGRCGWGDLVARAEQKITVPEAPGGWSADPIDIGEITTKEVKPLAQLEIGQAAPPFTVKQLNGGNVSLSDYAGKYLLLDFWATWCGPCRVEVPSLKSAYDAFKGNAKFAMRSLSLDADIELPKDVVKEEGLGWDQGFLGNWQEMSIPNQYGVRNIPSIFLIGPDGKIVAKDLRGTAIKEAIAKALGAK